MEIGDTLALLFSALRVAVIAMISDPSGSLIPEKRPQESIEIFSRSILSLFRFAKMIQQIAI